MTEQEDLKFETKQKLICMNKVIAEFMEAKFKHYDVNKMFKSDLKHYRHGEYWRCSFTPNDNFSWFFPISLKYDDNIEWQYEVMVKIKEIWDTEYREDMGVPFVECFNAWDSLDLKQIHVALYQFADYYLTFFPKKQ